jgi:two-component system sensor histidine kinase PilS (NtrC family)
MTPPDADRRSGERRRADRRAAGRRRNDGPASAFGNTDFGGGDSFFDPGWLAAGEARDGGQRLLRRARHLALEQESALARVYRTYAAARAAIGLGLVGVQGVGSLLGMRSSDALALVSLLYAAQATVLWLLPRFNGLTQGLSPQGARRGLWLATIGVDLLAFSLLHGLESGSTFNYGALLVLPVLMAGVLTNRLRALGTAAGVALMLLAIAWRAASGSADAPSQMLQAGLAGLGLFMITLLAGELSGRLAREEEAARDSLELARQQAQLNRLVIEEMADGVLVVDRKLNVRAANPAARALLVDAGLCVPAPFPLHHSPAWLALHQAVDRALREGRWPEAGNDVTLEFAEGLTRTLRLRVRFMRGRGLAANAPADLPAPVLDEPYAVLLLEDVRTLQARIRQEKLAAMGRVSAGIAHEIRNPLMAISQANDLMMEDPLSPPQLRLARMVADNVQRLKRLVDDVMEVAPGRSPEVQAVDAAAVVSQAAADWMRTAQALGAEQRLRAALPNTPLGVVFDPEHLRRVLVNLLDNAHRHASAEAGAISLRVAALDGDWVQLSVLSDGPPIAPEIERYLFEPFFSTRSRGSGLGLYICRELCERYGARIEFQLRPVTERLRNEFTVTMRRAVWLGSSAALPLEPS